MNSIQTAKSWMQQNLEGSLSQLWNVTATLPWDTLVHVHHPNLAPSGMIVHQGLGVLMIPQSLDSIVLMKISTEKVIFFIILLNIFGVNRNSTA